MGIDNSLDAGRIAIGRLERALGRAERAASLIDEQHENASAAGFTAPDVDAVRSEISAALDEIDALLSRDGRVPHHG